MPNITISIQADLMQRAKAYAAQRDISFSKLVERRLKSLLDEPDASTSSRDILQRFSIGDISRADAMRLLNVEDYGSLILMMGKESLPLPVRPASIAEPSIEVARSFIGGANAKS